MAAYGLYSHIQSNRRRSLALLVGLFLLVYVLVYAGALTAEALSVDADLNTLMQRAWNDLISAAPIATLGTALWVVIAYFFHQSMIDALTGGREVTRAEQPQLYNLLENLCISRGITMPKLKVMESDALNAFATGMNQKQYSITITSGLLGRLDDAEVESVLGHELTHIRNGDVRMMIIAVIIAGVVSFVAELVFRLWFYNGFSFRGSRSDRRGGGAGIAILIAVALLVLAYVLSFIIRLALSRSREFLADAGSVELTKNPDAMISALRKIEGRGELPGATSAVMEMCVDNPREGFGELFDSHPTVESRVAALVKFAGGHDPGPIALPPPADDASEETTEAPATAGPWGASTEDSGALPPSPPPIGTPSGPDPSAGPWGPHRGGYPRSRLGAGAGGDLRIPAAQMPAFLRNRHFHPAEEIDRHERRDIGDAVARAGDKFALRKAAIHLFEEARDARPPALGKRRNLRVVVRAGQRPVLQPGRRIAQRLHARVKAVPLDRALPGGDQRLLLGALAHQRRLRMRRLEIDADADRVGDAGAVVEFEHRHRDLRIDSAECGAELLVITQVDLHGRYADALLGEKNTDPPRARSGAAIIEFHLTIPRDRGSTTLVSRSNIFAFGKIFRSRVEG